MSVPIPQFVNRKATDEMFTIKILIQSKEGLFREQAQTDIVFEKICRFDDISTFS